MAKMYVTYMAHRTTLLLDDETHNAARELSACLKVSVSEAIRRAILSYRQAVLGASPEVRARRRQALEKLIELFEGHDAAEEVARLKAEDQGF